MPTVAAAPVTDGYVLLHGEAGLRQGTDDSAAVAATATAALGLGIVVRIKEEYGSIEEDEIKERDRQ